MKRLIPLMLTACMLSPVAGQTSGFKNIHRNPAGTAHPNLNFTRINGSKALKSTAAPAGGARIAKGLPRQALTDRKIIWYKNRPVFIETALPAEKAMAAPGDQFFAFMESVKSVTGIAEPAKAFVISDIRTDNEGFTHVRTNRTYNGIPLYGAEPVLHIGKGKQRLTGSVGTITGNLASVPVITREAALERVRNDLQTLTVVREFSEKERKLLGYEQPAISLVYYETGDNQIALTWAVEIRPNVVEVWKYFVDALTGQVLLKFNNTNSDGPATATAVDLNGVSRTIDTYLESGTYYLADVSEAMYNATTGDGMILTLDAGNTSTSDLNYNYITSAGNTWNHPAAVSAHFNATRTYEYLVSTFSRNSLNAQGGSIISFVNVAEDDGSSMENAFWNGKAVFYGNGGTYFKPLAGALDVAAHELGHGVVSNTANLDYNGQSGAMNEGFADIFGSMVDREDWNIGEDITKTSFSPSGSLRNMADPHNQGTSANPYWQPAHTSEMYLGSADNGGVHMNSGIINHAFYRYATAITKNKAEQVFYRALTNYLTKTSQFIDLRVAVIQSATDLYGAGSNEVVKAGEAFTAVGINDDQPTEPGTDYETNPGQDYLLTYDTNPLNSDRLWRSSTSGTNFVPLTATDMKGKVSVTDDGSAALFVSLDDKIRVLSTDPNDPQEFDLSDEAFFDNVAISKDGNRLAAISTEVDASIYVYDFVSQQWSTFTLYNPTTSESGVQAGGVLYADAIEFDHTGEYLIYDACNQLNSNSFDDITYWDIGFIRVWDNATQAFGDGQISKLYGSLPENVSIGNPVFSKNSSDIIAFDYFDETNDEYAVLGVDLTTGDLDVIATNTILGFPSFSKNDDRIAYSAITVSDEEVVAAVDLGDNKISAAGNPVMLVEYAKWPVYYATGSRPLGLEPVSNFSADLRTGSAPLKVQFFDLSANEPTGWNWTFQGGTPATSTAQNPSVTYSTPGTYKVTLVAANAFGNNTNAKTAYIVVTATTGIPEGTRVKPVAYPNPVSGTLHIAGAGERFELRITDLDGRLLKEATNQESVDVSSLPSGLYLLEIRTEERTVRQKIFIRP